MKLSIAILATLLAPLACAAPALADYSETETDNLAAVHSVFDNYAAGNGQAVLDALAPDVHWQFFNCEDQIPMHRAVEGRDGVAAWFAEGEATWQTDVFEPRQFFADGDSVIVWGHEEDTAKSTGKKVTAEWVAVFTFKDGLIADVKGIDNSGGEIAAMTPDVAPQPGP